VFYQWTNQEFENVPEIILVTGLPLLVSAAGTVVGLLGAVISFTVEHLINRRKLRSWP
jgi:hypothetical protein